MRTVDIPDGRKRDPYNPQTGSTGDDAEPTELDDDPADISDDEEGEDEELGR